MSRVLRHNAKGPALIDPGSGTIAIGECGRCGTKPFCDGRPSKPLSDEYGLLYAYDAEKNRVPPTGLFPYPATRFSAPK